ncbi:hypothetical protein J3459_008351 [Metarhizium acridum]|uniref:uncharacterized protein n=1 Tax=Metarhizium acridum TaxID=92637 RepID=UPI001C6BAF47|nr:hypothetical protein J3458_000031 [Metarhizium acridum]KAG8426205.1 hypothetical protein J3459_008351 [Metarhizium acridum]
MQPTEMLQKRLGDIYDQLARLRPDSPPEEFLKFASFFAEDSTVYLRSMREHADPAQGRAAIIEHLRDILKDQILEERRIVSQATNQDENHIFSEMENKYTVHGQILDPFHEVAVVTFSDAGLVSLWKQYSCRSPFVFFIQKATGVGPYNESVVK